MAKLRQKQGQSQEVPRSLQEPCSTSHPGGSGDGERLLSKADQVYVWDIPRWNSFEEIWPASQWMYDKFRAGGQPVHLLASSLMLDRATLLPRESMEWAARMEIEICQAERTNSLYEETGMMWYLLRGLWFSSELVDDLMALSDLDEDRAIGLDIRATTKRINYQHHGDMHELEDALDYARQAFKVLQSTETEIGCRVRFSLATLLRLRSSRLHSDGETETAERDASEAVDLFEELNNAARLRDGTGLEPAETASSLADALLNRYQQAGPKAKKADLESSMSWWKDSIDLTTEGNGALPLRLSGLGLATLEMAKSLGWSKECKELLAHAEHLQAKAYALAGLFSNHRDELVCRLMQTKTEHFRRCSEEAERHAALDEAIRYAEELFEIRRQARGEMLVQDIRWMESSIALFRLLHEATQVMPHGQEIDQRLDELKVEMREIFPLEDFLPEGSEGPHGDRIRKIALHNRETLEHSSRVAQVIDPILPPLSGKASLRLLFSDRPGGALSPQMPPPSSPPSSPKRDTGDSLLSKSNANPSSNSHRFEEEVSLAERAEDDVLLRRVTLTALDELVAAIHGVAARVKGGELSAPVTSGEVSTGEYRLRYAMTAWTRRFISRDSWNAATVTQLLEDIIAGSQCQEEDVGRVYYVLAYVFAHTYGTTKSPLLADMAVIAGERAVSKLNPRLTMRLTAMLSLAATYFLRGSRFCIQADLDCGISLIRRVATTTMCMRRETPRLWAQTMSLLASLYSARFEMLGAAEDLEHAIKSLGEAAVFLTKEDQGWPEVLAELARHVCIHAEERGEAPEAIVAVELLRAALDVPSIDGSAERGAMSTLAVLLDQFSHFYDDPSLAERALFLRRKIVSATNQLDPLWPVFAQDLARQLRQRSAAEPLANTGDGDEAAGLLRDAIRRTPPGHSLRCPLSMDLARVLMTRPVPDMKAVLAAADDALRTHYGPVDCVNAARLCAEVYYRDGKAEQAYTCLLRAIDALQSVSPQWLSLPDRQRLLKDMHGVQSDAACLGLVLNKPPADIVELLERSRTLILSSLLDCRGDLTELERVDGQLFEQLRSAQETLSRQSAHRDSWERLADESLDPGSRTRARQEANEKMNEALQKIRGLDGFGRFLLSPPVDQLLRLAVREPVILVANSSLAQVSFAIVLRSSGIQTLQLPRLNSADIAKHASALREACNGTNISGSYARGQKLCKVLRWLWKTTVQPILNAVAPEGAADKADVASLPHVCWIPVGVLSRFPFHAALGPGKDKNRPCAMDRVVSSYSGSLRSLLFARSRPPPVLSRNDSKFLAIAVEQTTPEGKDKTRFPRLDGVKEEGEELSSMFSQAAPLLDRPDAATALHAIRGCDIVHLACHGEADQTDPSASSLVLVRQRRPDDPPSFVERVDRLTVGRIFADDQRGSGAIAFLRACSTADNAAEDLPDEVIHLASAFQLAGFSHVLGTMWSTRNDACAAVTRRFYPRLLTADAAADDGHARVAEAFHVAVTDWMRSGDTWLNPLLWAPFVHYGA